MEVAGTGADEAESPGEIPCGTQCSCPALISRCSCHINVRARLAPVPGILDHRQALWDCSAVVFHPEVSPSHLWLLAVQG